MDTVESMRAFVRVVELGSFAAAARSLHLSPAMVTKHIGHLETRTGSRLLNRTTRQVRPTEIGQAYYDRCVALLAGIEEAENLAGIETAAPRGTLKVTAPAEFGNAHLAPIAAEFMQRHPGVSLTLDFSNRIVDLVQEGFDIAIRVARTLDTALVGRRLATSRFHVVASPQYLAAHGRPATPRDLADHACLTFAVPAPWDEWQFTRGGETSKVKMVPRLLSTSSEALRAAAKIGAGVSALPTFVCGADLRDGSLVSLFPDYDLGSLGIHALFLERRFMPARVRLFLDLLAERLGADAEADPWNPPAR
jgi:DNA-binding transcriptional LysR family regulator